MILPKRSAPVLSTIFVFAALATAQDSAPLLKFGITGSDPTGEYSRVIAQVPVQKLVLDVAHEPRSREFIDHALQGTNSSTDQLIRLGLIRPEAGNYRIAFNLLTRADDQRIREVTAKYSRFLTDAILKQKPELERLFAAYNLPSVSPAELAYIVVGCFALDWDGIDIVHQEKYFAETKENDYHPWAQEIGLPLKGIYWGSHNDYLNHAVFTSFGDHEALPRMAFPDVAWRMSSAAAKAQLAADLVTPSRAFAGRAFSSYLQKTGAAMFALRSGPKTAEEIAAAASLPKKEELSAILGLLLQLQYVRQDGDRYAATVPVLVARDRPMVNAARLVIWKAMHDWLRNYYGPLRADLQGITPLKYGVSYESQLFLQIWHYVFGITNGQLVDAGFFSSPYAAQRRYQGFIPAVWDPSLQELSHSAAELAPNAPNEVSTEALPPNLQKDVEAGNQEWIDGLKAGDAERAVASYSADAIFYTAAGDCIKGPAAIAALYKDAIAKYGRATGGSVRSDGLRVDHDLAYESGYAEAHFPNGAVRKGRYSTVWKLQPDGHWKIFRNLSLLPPTP